MTDTLRGPHPIFHLRKREGEGDRKTKAKEGDGSDSDNRKEETLMDQQPDSSQTPCLYYEPLQPTILHSQH